MNMEPDKKVTCKKCGKEIKIPADKKISGDCRVVCGNFVDTTDEKLYTFGQTMRGMGLVKVNQTRCGGDFKLVEGLQ